MKTKHYMLTNLSCANCADKIERKIKLIDDVSHVQLSFITKDLKVDLVNEDEEVVFKLIKKIIDDTEEGVGIYELDQKEVKYKIKGRLKQNQINEIINSLQAEPTIKAASYENKMMNISVYDQVSSKHLLDDIKLVVGKTAPELIIELAVDDDQGKQLQLVKILVALLLFLIGLLVGSDNSLFIPLFSLSYLIIGGEIVLKALKNIVKRKWFDESFLMSIATIAAFAIGEYPEAVAVMLFYQVGEYFQGLAVHRSRKSIKQLLSIKPERAHLKVNGQVESVLVDTIKINDIILIKPGERIPLDCEIIEGSSSIDTKILTGEALPVDAGIGDTLLSGCININGLIMARVTKSSSDSTVTKILELVQNASSKKAPTEQFITKFARYYTPVVVLSAILLAVIPPLLIADATFSEHIYRAAIFLVISCPCALVVSIPLGFFGGIGAASRSGILIKGGNYLEALSKANIGIFDKTGTITKGSFVVSEINPVEGISEATLLDIASHIESFSNHPIATSITTAYQRPIDQKLVSDVKEFAGMGLVGTYNNNQMIVGNEKLMNQNQITVQKSTSLGSIIYVSRNHEFMGSIVVNDEIKETSKETIKELRRLGFKKIVILTGDKHEISQQMALSVGVDEFYAELLPGQKLEQLEHIIKHKKDKDKVFVVGDGINDTPILARADIAIAMGGMGSDAAIEISDVVIMNDDPYKIIEAIKIAKKTKRIVWQNIIFSLGVKFVFLGLGAFGIANMWQAVFADVGVSIIAIFNALRLLRVKI